MTLRMLLFALFWALSRDLTGMVLEKLRLRVVLQDIFQDFAGFAARLASETFILNYLEFAALGRGQQHPDKVTDKGQ